MAGVLVVDASGGGNYTQIQAAVDAAVDGDTILVKTGTYVSFVVGNKALAIVGDTGASVQVTGAVRIRNLTADQTVVLQNLLATGVPPASSGYGLLLSNDQGHVRVEGCQFVGLSATVGSDAIRIESCADVGLTRTSGTGGSGGPGSGTGIHASGDGVHATGSMITIYDCSFRGGDGSPGNSSLGNGASGGDGCFVNSSQLFASGSLFAGGDGGQAGFPPACAFGTTFGGFGGNGIWAVGFTSPSDTKLLDDLTQAGAAGHAAPGSDCSEAGSPGLPRFGNGFTDLPGQSKHLVSPSTVRENTLATLTFTGVAGEQVRLLIARTAAYQYDATQEGVLLLGSPTRVVNMGFVPASGTLTVQLPVFTLGPSVPSIGLQLQARFTDPQGHSILSGPSAMVILNQTY